MAKDEDEDDPPGHHNYDIKGILDAIVYIVERAPPRDPKRKIIDFDLEWETLECGHKVKLLKRVHVFRRCHECHGEIMSKLHEEYKRKKQG